MAHQLKVERSKSCGQLFPLSEKNFLRFRSPSARKGEGGGNVPREWALQLSGYPALHLLALRLSSSPLLWLPHSPSLHPLYMRPQSASMHSFKHESIKQRNCIM